MLLRHPFFAIDLAARSVSHPVSLRLQPVLHVYPGHPVSGIFAVTDFVSMFCVIEASIPATNGPTANLALLSDAKSVVFRRA